jgi:hypothetical protein
MSDVYLHVGPVKTGSTYLQGLLWRNRRDLARQGYQHSEDHNNEMWLASNDVQDQAFVHFEMPEAAGVWARVCERVLGFEGPSIISHEVLGMSTEEHIARIVRSLAPARLHVVVMARSLAPMLPSLWQEKVKMVDPDISWPGFLASEREGGSRLTDASLIVRRWLAHVPPARVHVVTVPPRGAEARILLDRFAAALGIDTSTWTTDDDGAAANPSLDRVQVELLRRLNLSTSASVDRRAQRRLVQGALLPRMRAANPQRRIRLPPSERGWIEAETSRRIERLRSSGAVVYGDLAELEVPTDTWDEVSFDFSDADLLDEAIHLLASSHPDQDPDRLDIV